MTRHPGQEFTVGEIISLSTGLALYGSQTFRRIKPLGEFRTGLMLGLNDEPDVQSDDFITLTGWRLAVLQADNGQMWEQMVSQYPTAMLFGAIVVEPPETDEGLELMVEIFKLEAARNGIDLEQVIRITPLNLPEQALAARMYGNPDYQKHCVVIMLKNAAQA